MLMLLKLAFSLFYLLYVCKGETLINLPFVIREQKVLSAWITLATAILPAHERAISFQNILDLGESADFPRAYFVTRGDCVEKWHILRVTDSPLPPELDQEAVQEGGGGAGLLHIRVDFGLETTFCCKLAGAFTPDIQAIVRLTNVTEDVDGKHSSTKEVGEARELQLYELVKRGIFQWPHRGAQKIRFEVPRGLGTKLPQDVLVERLYGQVEERWSKNPHYEPSQLGQPKGHETELVKYQLASTYRAVPSRV